MSCWAPGQGVGTPQGSEPAWPRAGRGEGPRTQEAAGAVQGEKPKSKRHRQVVCQENSHCTVAGGTGLGLGRQCEFPATSGLGSGKTTQCNLRAWHHKVYSRIQGL